MLKIVQRVSTKNIKMEKSIHYNMIVKMLQERGVNRDTSEFNVEHNVRCVASDLFTYFSEETTSREAQNIVRKICEQWFYNIDESNVISSHTFTLLKNKWGYAATLVGARVRGGNVFQIIDDPYVYVYETTTTKTKFGVVFLEKQDPRCEPQFCHLNWGQKTWLKEGKVFLTIVINNDELNIRLLVNDFKNKTATKIVRHCSGRHYKITIVL